MAAAASATYGCLELVLKIRRTCMRYDAIVMYRGESEGNCVRRRRKHSIKQLIYFVGPLHSFDQILSI